MVKPSSLLEFDVGRGIICRTAQGTRTGRLIRWTANSLTVEIEGKQEAYTPEQCSYSIRQY